MHGAVSIMRLAGVALGVASPCPSPSASPSASSPSALGLGVGLESVVGEVSEVAVWLAVRPPAASKK
eukprot:scaffold19440_cov43-Phaeocystis_antarctica.AAC.1